MPMAPDPRTLDRQAMHLAKASMGGVAWPTIAFAFVIATGYGMTFVAAASGDLHLMAGFFINGLLVYASYTILHETVHGNISGFGRPPRWYNEAIGCVAGFIMATPLTSHRVSHLAHHRNTNDPDADPDMVMAIEKRIGLFSLFVASLRSILKQYTYFLGPGWSNTTPRDRWLSAAEVIGIVGIRLGLAIAGYPLEVLVLTVLANLLGNFLIVTFFAVAVHHPHNRQGRYLDTSIIVFRSWINTPVTWLWLGQNYHAVHHLFPRVPFYRYATLFARIGDIMAARGTPIQRIG